VVQSFTSKALDLVDLSTFRNFLNDIPRFILCDTGLLVSDRRCEPTAATEGEGHSYF